MKRQWLLFALLLIAPGTALGEKASDIIVIVNINNSESVQLATPKAINRLFSNHLLTWPDQTPVILYDLPPEHPVRLRFSESIMKMSASKVAQQWAHLKITNQATNPPLTMKHEHAVLRKVARQHGAIGYVSRNALTHSPYSSQIKTLYLIPLLPD